MTYDEVKREVEEMRDIFMSDEMENERELLISTVGLLLAAPFSTRIWMHRGAPKWAAKAITSLSASIFINRYYQRYYYQKSR